MCPYLWAGAIWSWPKPYDHIAPKYIFIMSHKTKIGSSVPIPTVETKCVHILEQRNPVLARAIWPHFTNSIRGEGNGEIKNNLSNLIIWKKSHHKPSNMSHRPIQEKKVIQLWNNISILRYNYFSLIDTPIRLQRSNII